MATLLFSAVGTAIGGPLGGVVGALLGRQVDNAILGNGHVRGPRLSELQATTSSYGSVIARHYGRMRVPGTVIWSTNLVESSETRGGKNGPDVTTYSYSVSFAVALASRPIKGIGRIWADGRLLRGEADDLKASGTMRVYTGQSDQAPDPLIAAKEGMANCPAYRGVAYVVFEDLDLSEFCNRLPALTFEVIADEEGFSLADIVGEVIEAVDAGVPLPELNGFTCEGPISDTLSQLQPIYPIDADANGAKMIFARERLQSAAIPLPEAAISVEDGAFGGGSGYAVQRMPVPERAPEVLRYYDIDRDYLPGLQRSIGQPGPGQPQALDLPAALSASNARKLVETLKQKANWQRDQLSWRCSQIDPSLVPGAVVTVPGRPGRWSVEEWEWRPEGVELSLKRVVPTGADAMPSGQTEPGRINHPADLPAPPTTLIAFELPWDGTGSSSAPQVYAAVSSSGVNWSGAALFVDHGSGELETLGPSGRTRSIAGVAVDALGTSNPLLLDRSNSVTVHLVAEDMNLTNATHAQLAAGWNKALLGEEVLQFSHAEALGDGLWRLSGLVRGLGGTDAAIGRHISGEHFVLLNQKIRTLEPAIVGTVAGTEIVASGRGDANPLASPVALHGITMKPLVPVHGRSRWLADGSLKLGWVRRARGAWLWSDGIDVPLVEDLERYILSYGSTSNTVATWPIDTNEHVLSAAQIAELLDIGPDGHFSVKQQGSFALSDPLHITL